MYVPDIEYACGVYLHQLTHVFINLFIHEFKKYLASDYCRHWGAKPTCVFMVHWQRERWASKWLQWSLINCTVDFMYIVDINMFI